MLSAVAWTLWMGARAMAGAGEARGSRRIRARASQSTGQPRSSRRRPFGEDGVDLVTVAIADQLPAQVVRGGELGPVEIDDQEIGRQSRGDAVRVTAPNPLASAAWPVAASSHSQPPPQELSPDARP